MGDLSDQLDMLESLEVVELSTGWSFRQSDGDDEQAWMPVKRVPSTVHQDLIDNQKIPHPFVGFNEIKAEWVGTRSWTYKTRFTGPPSRPGSRVVLVFQGLDTFALVKLDGKAIHRSDNMFLTHRVDVSHMVVSGRQHVLEVDFEPAFTRAREIQKQHPDHKFICFNGDPARLCVRKAQYHWGWDWGPFLMCAGIWRPVRLEVYTTRIHDFRIDVDVALNCSSAGVTSSIEIEGYEGSEVVARFDINFNGKSVASAYKRVDNSGRASHKFTIDNPKLWMPNGYGEQSMYQTVATILADNRELHTESKQVGLRRVELVQQPDRHGKSFFFRINGVDIFCGGSCWIPADSFLTNVSPDRYRAWIELMVPANQRMIRVWGGGIYEDDAFYDICDELGILVWQDFMFGCGNYPAYPSFLRSVETEAIQNVRRLRHHPSIVIFAGNNEDYQVQESAHLTYDYDDKDEENWLKTDFPARYIYESLLPRVMANEAPTIPYHPGSPWGDGKISSDPTVGDMHQWNVWHGTQEKYQIFDTLGGRFNSEFGMEAFPHMATIESFVEDQKELYAQSHVLDFHNKADGHERRIATYLVENVRSAAPTDLATHIYLTQLIQCEALMFGYRGWRRQWGDDRHCGGALVWQLNDCWPVTSWSIVDYYLRRKAAYYALARVLAPVAVGIRRSHHDWSVTHAREPKTQRWELWAVSAMQDVVADVEIRFISVETGSEIKDKIVKQGIRVTGNGTTEITAGYVDNENEEPHVLAARLWIDGHIVARDTDWPQPFKYLRFPDRKLDVRVSADGKEIHITTQRPVKCLVFEEREGCHLSDSAIDVLPRDAQTISVRGHQEGTPPLSWTYLGANEQ